MDEWKIKQHFNIVKERSREVFIHNLCEIIKVEKNHKPSHHFSYRPRIFSRQIQGRHWRFVSPPRNGWWLGWCRWAVEGRGRPPNCHCAVSRTCWWAPAAARLPAGYIFARHLAASRKRTPCLVTETWWRFYGIRFTNI